MLAYFRIKEYGQHNIIHHHTIRRSCRVFDEHFFFMAPRDIASTVDLSCCAEERRLQ